MFKHSVKMTAEEMSNIVKAAVKEAMNNTEEGTPEEDFLQKVSNAVNEEMEKRKADPAAEDEEEKADGEEDEEEEKSEEVPDGREEPKKGKADAPKIEKKGADKPMQRKYSEIYFSKPVEEKPASKKEIPAPVKLARAIKCYDVFGHRDPDQAAFYAKKYYQDDEMSRQFKALTATVPSGGGYLIPEIYVEEIIELLYPKTVIFELGARKVPMANGNLTIPKMTSGARATWGGELRKISKTQPAFGNIKLSAKRLAAIVPQSRELMMSTNFSADDVFARDLMRRMQLGLDYGGMFGTGGEFQPLGVTKTPGIEVMDCNTITDTSIVDSSDKITADFPVYVVSTLLQKNIDDQACGWAFNSRMEGYLKNMKTSTGTYIYRDEMNTGKLIGFPYKISNQIPVSSSNKTEMLFGNWADLMVGEQLGLETYTTLDGSWVDEDSVQHNAFDENLAATRALMYVDIAVRHPESFAHVKNAVL